MDSNVTFKGQATRPSGIMTYHDYTVVLIPMSTIGFLTALMGSVTNSICIHVFLQIKGKDAVYMSFLGLASSDLTLSLLSLGFYGFASLMAVERLYGPQTRYDAYLLFLYFGSVCICVNAVTILITLYLAIARCLCVAMPLRFKYSNMFTPTQTRVFIIGAWIFSFGVYVPIFAKMGIQEVFSPALNTTKFILWLAADINATKDGVYLLIQTIIPFSTQVILIICIAVMVTKLVQASKFRHGGLSTKDEPNAGKSDIAEDENGNDLGKGPDKDSVKLSGKELQAVKQVVLISVIFVACNIPMVVVTVTSLMVPGFSNPSGSNSIYGRLYITAHGYKRLFELINSSINLFVYYRFNSKFRNYCRLDNFLCMERKTTH